MPELVALLAPLFAAIMLRTDRRIARTLREEGATTPEGAFPFDPQNALVRWRLHRLAAAGAVKRAAEGRWYLDEAALSAYRWQRRKHLLIILAIVVPLMLAIAYAQRGS